MKLYKKPWADRYDNVITTTQEPVLHRKTAVECLWLDIVTTKRAHFGLDIDTAYALTSAELNTRVQKNGSSVFNKLRSNIFSIIKPTQTKFPASSYTLDEAEQNASRTFSVPLSSITRSTTPAPFNAITPEVVVAYNVTWPMLRDACGFAPSDLITDIGFRSLEQMMQDAPRLFSVNPVEGERMLTKLTTNVAYIARDFPVLLGKAAEQTALAHEIARITSMFCDAHFDSWVDIGLCADILYRRNFVSSYASLALVPWTAVQLARLGFSCGWLHQNMKCAADQLGAWAPDSLRHHVLTIPPFSMTDWIVTLGYNVDTMPCTDKVVLFARYGIRTRNDEDKLVSQTRSGQEPVMGIRMNNLYNAEFTGRRAGLTGQPIDVVEQSFRNLNVSWHAK